ncbi:MAG: helix-turn-helix transcriptional regulator [Methylomonas sp.]|jgi:transcriptional regulator with XRE-family HTH domain
MNTEDENMTVQERLNLAIRLREAREYLGISQDEAAVVLGISRPAVTLIESGGRKIEAIELGRLASLYGCSLDYLLTGQREQTNLQFLARATKGLSDNDLDQLARFSDFLRVSSQTNQRSKE